MIPVQTLRTEARSLLLKLVSVTLHEWWLWLCQEGCKQHFPLAFDPNPCRHSAASMPSGSSLQSFSAELCEGLRCVQHMAAHREGSTSLSHADTRVHPAVPAQLPPLSPLGSSSSAYFADNVPYFVSSSTLKETQEKKLFIDKGIVKRLCF